jgi:hypothetical protein
MASNASRYADSSIVKIDRNGTTSLAIEPSLPAQEWIFDFTYHQISAAEGIDEIAFENYGDGSKWWIIASANPEILDWYEVPVGTIIRVPSA